VVKTVGAQNVLKCSAFRRRGGGPAPTVCRRVVRCYS
jgi:hypothetical protein